MQPKPDPKTNPKNDCFLESLRIDFGSRRVAKWQLGGWFGSWAPLGAKIAPRGPKTASKTDFGANLYNLKFILDGFWMDFTEFVIEFWFKFGFGFRWCDVDTKPQVTWRDNPWQLDTPPAVLAQWCEACSGL